MNNKKTPLSFYFRVIATTIVSISTYSLYYTFSTGITTISGSLLQNLILWAVIEQIFFMIGDILMKKFNKIIAFIVSFGLILIPSVFAIFVDNETVKTVILWTGKAGVTSGLNCLLAMIPELFPTNSRGVAGGVIRGCGAGFSFISPFLVVLKSQSEILYWIAQIVLSLVGILAVVILPKTDGLPDSYEDCAKQKTIWYKN